MTTHSTRRQFLTKLSLSLLATTWLPVQRAWAKAKKVAFKLAKAEALRKIGGTVTLKLKGRTVLFVRDAEDSVKALDPTCTHQKCTVAWIADKKRIECPCHASAFDLEGKVLAGPATKPLKTYAAAVDREKDRIVVTLED
jgi:cytochrome b6-f complex iron-sulfur subunit